MDENSERIIEIPESKMGFKCVYESLNEDTEQERKVQSQIIHRMKAKESQECRSQECIYCVWRFKGILSCYSTR